MKLRMYVQAVGGDLKDGLIIRELQDEHENDEHGQARRDYLASAKLRPLTKLQSGDVFAPRSDELKRFRERNPEHPYRGGYLRVTRAPLMGHGYDVEGALFWCEPIS